MPKVSVTVKDGRTARTYEDDFAFILTLHESCGSPEGRWYQHPENWKDGMGLFFAGIEALQAVACQEGNERFRVAARAALESLNGFAPKESGDESAGEDSECTTKGRGTKQRGRKLSRGGCKGSESNGCSCHDAPADDDRKEDNNQG
jgi:hypothetical protein